LNLGEFVWDIYQIKKNKMFIWCERRRQRCRNNWILTIMNEGSALVMAKQGKEVNYKIKINGRMVDMIRTLKFRVNRINDRLIYNCLPLQGKFENFNY
jgi:hypothetical protein